MKNFDKAILEEYASLKASEKSTKARIAELSPLIKAAMEGTDTDKLESDFGNFTLVSKPVWKFSSAVDEAEQKVEDLKAHEKAIGVAEETVRTDLVFKAAKSEE